LAADARQVGGSHRELWEVVRDEIRDLIIAGSCQPGDRLVEATLADRFAVSRGPVRTALMELEQVGLVTSLPRRGMQVTMFERSDIDELFDITLALERMAAREATESASDAEVAHLHRLLDELDEAQHRGDHGAAVEADLELHRHLMKASGNRRLLKLWTGISDEIRFVISVVQRAMPDVEWASYNRPIVEAVATRDAELAEQAVVSCFTVAHEEIRALSAEAFTSFIRRPAPEKHAAVGARE
jgi:DNA-binding GntR family transcriptional regulator